MRTLSLSELHTVNGARASLLNVRVTDMEILVTNSARYVCGGSYYGHHVNAILYANEVHDLADRNLGYDLSQPFSHNGHLVQATPVTGGYIYKIIFDEG